MAKGDAARVPADGCAIDKGGGQAAAVAAGADAAPATIYAFEAIGGTIAPDPDLTAAECIVDGCVGCDHAALRSPQGAVLCIGRNSYGELGVGDRAPRGGLAAARLPWPAAAVRCGSHFSVALRRGGAAVCSWGQADRGELGRGGDATVAAEVQGLPAGDPVVLLDAGMDFVIAVTQSGEAYGWGDNRLCQLALGRAAGAQPAPVRIAALSGRGLVSLTCGGMCAFAETRHGELLRWDSSSGGQPEPLRPVADRPALPFRSLAASGGSLVAADAVGLLWMARSDDDWEGTQLYHAGPRRAGRFVRVAAAADVIALTADGNLWQYRSERDAWRSITTAGPRLPLGLLPFSGSDGERIILVPDRSCGLRRCRICILSAGRRGLLPGGQMCRGALIPFLVYEEFIFEKQLGADAAAEESAHA